MVRVLAIADEEDPHVVARAHRQQIELVLSAGDLRRDYIESVALAAGAPVAFVPGNHDLLDVSPHGAVNVDRTVIELAGLRIAGLGGSVAYNQGRHQYTQQQFADAASDLTRLVDGPVDVLLTHAPPRGLGDQPDPAHIGIEALHDLIDALQPTWHLHGHVHPYGMHKPDRQLSDTIVRNVIPSSMLEIVPHGMRVPR